MTGVRDF